MEETRNNIQLSTTSLGGSLDILQDSNMSLEWLSKVLSKFFSLNQNLKSYLYMLYIMNSSLKYQGLRLGDSKDMAVGPSFLPWIVCLWAFI